MQEDPGIIRSQASTNLWLTRWLQIRDEHAHLAHTTGDRTHVIDTAELRTAQGTTADRPDTLGETK